jgi:hypothetical protein
MFLYVAERHGVLIGPKVRIYQLNKVLINNFKF